MGQPPIPLLRGLQTPVRGADPCEDADLVVGGDPIERWARRPRLWRWTAWRRADRRRVARRAVGAHASGLLAWRGLRGASVPQILLCVLPGL